MGYQIMNLWKSFKNLSRFEFFLWLFSALGVSLSFLLSPSKDYLSLMASLIGVTSLIFIAKGDVIGQILTIIFSLLYGIISWQFRYYGEMITYLCMTAPTALAAVITWIKNPFAEREVKVSVMTPKKFALVMLANAAVTAAFYFILEALGTNNLIVSTVSIATSFAAASLLVLRSPYYALFYGANDIVLIVMWVLASIEDPSFLPMIACFFMFLFNDVYAYINWNRMRRRQLRGE